MISRKEEEDRRTREETVTVDRMVVIQSGEDSGEEKDKEDDEPECDVDETEIWEVTHVTEEDLETTEGRRWIY